MREHDTAAGPQRLRLSFEPGPEPVPVEGDERRLEQVVANLLRNAVSYTPAGGDIRVSLVREGGEAVLRVADTGVGIAAEKLPHVFDLFARRERLPDRPAGGLGIGLPLVRALVEMHGGRVEAHSEGPGRGSEFVVRLPLKASPERRRAGPPSAGGRRGRRMLIVEDNPDGRETLRHDAGDVGPPGRGGGRRPAGPAKGAGAAAGGGAGGHRPAAAGRLRGGPAGAGGAGPRHLPDAP